MSWDEQSKAFQECWKNVKAQYQAGFCVSERGLQSDLVCALRQSFPSRRVVVEPQWKSSDGKVCIPDLVMLNGDRITDIFELKYAPHWYVNFRGDIQKLSDYRNDKNATFRVEINPGTGTWKEGRYGVFEDTIYHFVAVAKFDSEAVFPECLVRHEDERDPFQGRLLHWYGRIGGDGEESIKWKVTPVS